MSALPLIINPAAGGGRCGQIARALVPRLADAGKDVQIYETTGPGHATQLARKLRDKGEHTLLVAGGDGTTYEIVNGVMGTPGLPKAKLGLLPCGTGNSFLRDFDITDVEGALKGVLAGSSVPVDVVQANHTEGHFYYLNLLSIGFTSAVGSLTNRRFKFLGANGYTVATVLEVARLKAQRFPHALDGGELVDTPVTFLSFSNSKYTGGTMMMAPSADVTDGKLDVIHIGGMGRLDLLKTFPKIYQGKHLEHPANHGSTAALVRFELPAPVDIMVDGEIVTAQLTGLEVLPGALEVFV